MNSPIHFRTIVLSLVFLGAPCFADNQPPTEEITFKQVAKEKYEPGSLRIIEPKDAALDQIRVMVAGCVETEGIYYLPKGLTVEEVIKHAGGRNRLAYASHVIVTNYELGTSCSISVKQGGSQVVPQITKRLRVEDGDIIFIPMIM